MQRILFQGDSITDCGRIRNDCNSLGEGYVKKLSTQLDGYEILNRGISGDKVIDLRARWDRDCIELKPDILSVLIGVNDVWHTLNDAVKSDDAKFEMDYRFILERVRKELPNTKIIVLEPFLLKVGAGSQAFRDFLNKKIDIVREVAKDLADAFVPLDGIIQSYRCKFKDEELLLDGVHPSDLGHSIIASGILSCIKNEILTR